MLLLNVAIPLNVEFPVVVSVPFTLALDDVNCKIYADAGGEE